MALGTLTNNNSTTEIELLHPVTGLPLGVRVTVYGADSDKFKLIQRRQLDRRLEQQSKKRGRFVVTADILEAEAMELLTGCIVSWRSEVKGDQGTTTRPEIELGEGEWLPCTPENARRLCEVLPWLKEQLDEAIGDRANFLQS